MTADPNVELAHLTVGAVQRATVPCLVNTAATIGSELRHRASPDSVWGRLDAPIDLRVIEAAIVAAAAEEPDEKRPTGRFMGRAARLAYEAVQRQHGHEEAP